MRRNLPNSAVQTGPDGGGIGTPAHQSNNSIQDDGFACAGFTGESNQAGTGAQFQMVDDGEILDTQFGKHISRLSADLNTGEAGIDRRCEGKNVNNFPDEGQNAECGCQQAATSD